MLSPEQKAERAAYNKIYRKDYNAKTPRIRKNVKESKTCWNCKQTTTEPRFCNDACKNTWMLQHASKYGRDTLGENNPNFGNTVEITKQCDTCGKDVTRRPSDFRAEQAFCDYVCANKYLGKIQTEEAKVSKICELCSISFEVRKCEGAQRFCSTSCSNAILRKPGYSQGFREDIGMYVRSTLEANYIRILNYQKIPYQYEPNVYKVEGHGYYTPDFYLPLTGEYIELKGYVDPKQLEKYKAFEIQNPTFKYTIIEQTSGTWKDLEKQFKSLIPKWE